MLEKDIELVLTKRIKDLGGIAYKFVSPSRRSVPDRLCLLPGGRVLFIEVKSPGKKPTKFQELEHRKLRSLGFEVLVIDNRENANAIC